MKWFSNFDLNNQYTSVILFSLATSLFNGFYMNIINFITFILKTIFISWIEIDNMDPDGKDVYEWLTFYLSHKMKNGNLYSTTKSIETASSLNKIWYDNSSNSNFPQTRFVPGPSWSILFDSGIYFIHTVHGNASSNAWGDIYNVNKKITIYKLMPFISHSWETFIKIIKTYYEKDICKYQRIYKSRESYRSHWDGPILIDRLKLSDGLFILTEPMKELVDDIKYFLSDESKKKFKENGFCYCKRLCIYGPPGTGKSNLAVRIAGEYDLPIYYLNCQNLSNESLTKLFDSVQRGIIIIEELDKCIHELVKHVNSQNCMIKDNPLEKETDTGNYPRLIAWHRVLDKIVGHQVIVYATTNNIELLKKLNHGSVIRSERMDKLVYFGYADKNVISEMITKYYGKAIDLSDNINYEYITPADIINILKNQNTTVDNINSILENISNIKQNANNKINPIINDLMQFINVIVSKSNETLSSEFVLNVAHLLNKNGVTNAKDATRLFKSKDDINKLLKNGNLPLLDEIKFKNILDEDDVIDNIENIIDDNIIVLPNDIKQYIIDSSQKNNIKTNDNFFNNLAMLLDRMDIYELEDFILAIKTDDFISSLKNDKEFKTIDKIKLKKIINYEK